MSDICQIQRIVLIQHTESMHHTNGMIGGWTDWELTSTGREQAEAIARAIGREFVGRPVRLFTSDLLRARQTAEPIAASLHVKPEPCHALRELHLGSATGKPVAWLREHQAEQTTDIPAIDHRCLPDAESKRDHYNRLNPFLEQICLIHDHDLMIVAHGGTISLILSVLVSRGIESMDRIGFTGLPGGVSLLVKNSGGTMIVRKINDLSYLAG